MPAARMPAQAVGKSADSLSTPAEVVQPQEPVKGAFQRRNRWKKY